MMPSKLFAAFLVLTASAVGPAMAGPPPTSSQAAHENTARPLHRPVAAGAVEIGSAGARVNGTTLHRTAPASIDGATIHSRPGPASINGATVKRRRP